MRHAGVAENSEEWQYTVGVLDKFAKLGMITFDNEVITLSNWSKRQGNALSGYERLKRHREKYRNDNNDNVIRPLHDNRKKEREIERKKEDASKEAGNANANSEEANIQRIAAKITKGKEVLRSKKII